MFNELMGRVFGGLSLALVILAGAVTTARADDTPPGGWTCIAVCFNNCPSGWPCNSGTCNCSSGYRCSCAYWQGSCICQPNPD